MKRSLIVSIKLLLTVLFLFNIGFFSLLSNLEDRPQPPMKADRGREDNQYLSEKVKRAQELGKAYGPEEYFADLTAIRLKEKQNDFDRFAILQVNSSTMQLLALFDANIKAARIDLSPAEYDDLMERLSNASQLSQDTVDPDLAKRLLAEQAERQAPGYWNGIITNILVWLLGFYLQNLPLAFILLWLWWYQDRNKLGINNPLSFLICIILYPLVIGRAWHQVWREGVKTFAFRVERQRREVDIFSLLSSNELAEVRRFAQTHISLSEYRQTLDELGLCRHHRLLPAIVVITIAILLPTLASSATAADDYHAGKQIEMVSTVDGSHAPPEKSAEFDWSVPILPSSIIVTLPGPQLLQSVVTAKKALLHGFKNLLDPVPLSC